MSAVAAKTDHAVVALCTLGLVCLGACGHASPSIPAPLPERAIAPPANVDRSPVEAAAVLHVLRGLYSLAMGQPKAAVPHLRLALIYQPDSPFIHEELADAWWQSGAIAKARHAVEQGLQSHPNDAGLNQLAGEMELHARDYAAAVRHLEVACRGSDLVVRRAGPELVDALLWQGHTTQALRRAAALLRAHPGNADFADAIGAYLEDHGQLAASLRAYQQAQEQRPSDRTAAFGAMRVLELQNHLQQAADALVPLLSYNPDDIQLYVTVTRLLRQAGAADADVYRAEALRQSAGDPASLTLVASGDIAEGRVDLGLALLRDVVRHFPGAARARKLLVLQLARMGRTQQCLATARGARRTLVAHAASAQCYGHAGHFEAMTHELVAIAHLVPQPDPVVMAAVQLLWGSADAHRAQQQLDEIIAGCGTHLDASDAALARAQLLDSLGEGDKALQIVAGLVQQSPHDVRLQLRQADLEARYGKVDAAVQQLEKLVGADPFAPAPLNALGFILADANRNLSEAEVWLRRAYRESGDASYVVDSLGWLLFRQGHLGQAAQLLRRAVRAAPDDPQILRHLADIYVAQAHRAQATTLYRKALASHPGVPLRRLLERQLAGLGGT